MPVSLKLGAWSLGTEPLAASPQLDDVSVTVTAPTGTVSTGGPEVTVTWTYAQPQNRAQEQFRVRLVSDDGSTEYYDSGWQFGSNVSWAIDLDASTSVPPTTTDLKSEVSVRGPAEIGTGYEATDTQEWDLDYGDPYLVINEPDDGDIHTDPNEISVGWTFSDGPGHVQSAYRVRLLQPSTEIVLIDTGWVSSDSTSATITYGFVDDTQVLVEVQAKNQHGYRTTSGTPPTEGDGAFSSAFSAAFDI